MAKTIKNDKLARRQRTKRKIRRNLNGTDVKPRVSVFRSTKHIYAQVISDESNKTLFGVSTLDKDFAGKLAKLGDNKEEGRTSESKKSVNAAKVVGMMIAERMETEGIKEAVYHRNCFMYQGRIKALADGMRVAGFKI